MDRTQARKSPDSTETRLMVDKYTYIPAKTLAIPPPNGDSHYNFLICGSDSKLYFGLSNHDAYSHAQLYRYDPENRKCTRLADVGCLLDGNTGLSIPQGKLHVRPIQYQKMLFGASHIGYYHRVNGIAVPGTLPGRASYPGGHFFSFDLASGKIRSLGQAPRGEGILCQAFDVSRGTLYGLTWPSGRLVCHVIGDDKVTDLGAACGVGETLDPQAEQICRALVVDQVHGDVYWTRENGTVFRFCATQQRIGPTEFCFETTLGGESWRTMIWNPSDHAYWGTLVRSGSFVRFSPSQRHLRVFPTAVPTQAPLDSRGRPFTRASLGCVLTHGNTRLRTLLRDWVRTKLGYWESKIRIVSFDIPKEQVVQESLLCFESGLSVEQAESLESVGTKLYAIGRPISGFSQRLLHHLACRLGREHDSHPGAFRLMEWEDDLP